MAGLVSVNKFTNQIHQVHQRADKPPRGGPEAEARESMREVGRGPSGVLLAVSERAWVGGTLSLAYLLAVSTSREGALYYPRAQSKPEADTPKTQ